MCLVVLCGSARERVAPLESEGDLREVTVDALAIVQQVLDVSGDDRLAILLMSEIRIHALRDPQLGAAYLAQNEDIRTSVAHGTAFDIAWKRQAETGSMIEAIHVASRLAMGRKKD